MYYSELISEEIILKEDHLDGKIGCCEIGGTAEVSVPYNRKEAWHHFLICNRGEVTILNEQTETVIRRGFISISNNAHPTKIQFTKNFHGYLISMDFNLFLDMLRSASPSPAVFSEHFRRMGGLSGMQAEEVRTLSKDSRNILSTLGRKEHLMLEKICMQFCGILVTDLIDMLWKRHENIPKKNYYMDRGDEILRQFMHLAAQNIEKETKVGFYAEKLFISKQYLSEVILKKTCHTIGVVLSTFRFEWSMRYINDPSMTIQQIASRMSFPDQSSFGKFFKMHSGSSPAQYRKEHKIM